MIKDCLSKVGIKLTKRASKVHRKNWPRKRKATENNKENQPTKKRKSPIDDDKSCVTSKENGKAIRNVNARELYKAQKQKLKCITINQFR